MIHVPSFGKSGEVFFHSDSEEENLCYIDDSRPRVRGRKQAGGWIQLPGEEQAVFVGELEFGFGGHLDAGAMRFLDKRCRTVSMPWAPSAVCAWSIQGAPGAGAVQVPQVLCTGETSGYGVHNCVLQSPVRPMQAAGAPLIAVALLDCPAVLEGGGVDAEIAARDVSAALQALVSERADTVPLPLGYALGQVLRMLVERRVGSIRIRSHALSPTALTAMRDLVIGEWMHRIAASSGGHDALVRPLGAFPTASLLDSRIDLGVRWTPGDRVTHRVLRMHRFPPACFEANAGARESCPNRRGEIELHARGDWKSFDFAEVCLRAGGREEHRTLRRDSATATIELGDPDPEKIEVTAFGAVSGFGRKVPLVSRWATRNRMEVELPGLVEVAFLLKADRQWLRAIGAVDVGVSHDGLVRMLTPANGVARLDPCLGTANTVSAVVRALVTKDRAKQPFHLSIGLEGECGCSWDACPVDGDVAIHKANLPLFRARRMHEGVMPAALELAVAADGPGAAPGGFSSLGERLLRADTDQVAWILPDGAKLKRVRARFEHDGRSFTTAWEDVTAYATEQYVVPEARLVEIIALAFDSDAEIEIAGDGGGIDSPAPYQAIVRVGTPSRIRVLRVAGSGEVRFRTRSVARGAWSAWVTTTARVVAIHDGRAKA